MEDEEDVFENSANSNTNNSCVNCLKKSSDSRIMHNHPFFHCKEHPKFENIHLEVIESHLILAKDDKVS